jgi:hypothetical protein
MDLQLLSLSKPQPVLLLWVCLQEGINGVDPCASVDLKSQTQEPLR